MDTPSLRGERREGEGGIGGGREKGGRGGGGSEVKGDHC